MMEHPGLDTPGGLIRAKRESLGISLPEMSERTKIPPQVLEAIERDEYHKVSGALYIKSFLRTCAVELGLDADEVLSLYGSFSGDLTPRSGTGDSVWSEDEVQISHIGLPWRNIGLVGAVLVVAGVGALLFARGCSDQVDGPDATLTMPAETRPDLAQGADEVPNRESLLAQSGIRPADESGSRSGSRSADLPDTLAGAWTSGRDTRQTTPPATELPKATGKDQSVGEVESAVKDTEPAMAKPKPTITSPSRGVTPKVTSTTTRPALPLPVVGGPGLVFAGGQKKPVVLRVICDRPLGIQVKRDAEQTFAQAKWPVEGAVVPPLPPTGIEPGRVYGVSRGLVVYWGAEDHLSLRLDRTDGVEVALNGKVRNVRNLRPGGELLLDDHGN